MKRLRGPTRCLFAAALWMLVCACWLPMPIEADGVCSEPFRFEAWNLSGGTVQFAGALPNLGFGTSPLPLRVKNGYASIPLASGIAVSVDDELGAGFQLLASIGAFQGDDLSFPCELAFDAPGVSASGSPGIHCASGGGLRLSVSADAPDSYTLSWSADAVRLLIEADDAASIAPGDYRASVTWTLAMVA